MHLRLQPDQKEISYAKTVQTVHMYAYVLLNCSRIKKILLDSRKESARNQFTQDEGQEPCCPAKKGGPGTGRTGLGTIAGP